VTTQAARTDQVWDWLGQVADPEIPVISVVDLGIVRAVAWHGDECVVTITPTYSGCEAGKQALKGYGIAPPAQQVIDISALHAGVRRGAQRPLTVACPNCGATHTELTSQFGSTPCKALYKCLDCREPFDYFKCH
jgi:ring-1,2-phenylacetyl-CoA epoxidase subunit PaaD